MSNQMDKQMIVAMKAESEDLDRQVRAFRKKSDDAAARIFAAKYAADASAECAARAEYEDIWREWKPINAAANAFRTAIWWLESPSSPRQKS